MGGAQTQLKGPHLTSPPTLNCSPLPSALPSSWDPQSPCCVPSACPGPTQLSLFSEVGAACGAAGAEGRHPDAGTPISSPGRRQPPTRPSLRQAVSRQGLHRPLVALRRDPTQTGAAGKVAS